MLGTNAIAVQSFGVPLVITTFPLTLTQADIASIVAAIMANPLLLTVPKFLALK